MKFRLLRTLLPLTLSLGAAADEGNHDDVWLLVETGPHVLKVMEGDQPVEVFEKIAIGRRGVGLLKERGDDKTPLGRFRIGWINENSRYRRFFGFTFPNRDNAEIAYQTGLIGENTFRAIVHADLRENVPPQNTPLGGQIGIHGLGAANPAIHQQFDWTHGCIAMTNEQIDRLRTWVKKGIPVIIR